MNVTILIQARMGSTRLPGKVLMDLAGKTVLDHVLDRAGAADVGESIVLTTFDHGDLPIVAHCAARGTRVFCGSQSDVLDRYFQASRLLRSDHLVRITADCPLLDPGLLRKVVERHLASGADYTSNIEPETFPDGLDCEVFTRAALERAWNESTIPSDREHVTPYLRRNTSIFRHASVVHHEDLTGMRWTLDTPSDLEFLRAVVSRLAPGERGMERVLELLGSDPTLGALNAGQVRNEGYLKSLAEDPRNGQ